jgi:hypothetical protein
MTRLFPGFPGRNGGFTFSSSARSGHGGGQRTAGAGENEKPAVIVGGLGVRRRAGVSGPTRGSLLPRALFVPVGFEALAAFVFRHFQPTFLFQIAHGV